MKVTSTMLLEIAAMPEQAMAASIRFLAAQLEAEERKRAFANARQKRYRDANVGVTITSLKRHSDAKVTARARVDNKPLPSLQPEISRKVSPLVIPPTPQEPTDFEVFWATYPKRAGGRDKQGAVKAFKAALKRAPAETITAGAAVYAAYCRETGKEGSEFVFKARTWLNNNSWTEEYSNDANPTHKPNSIAGGFAILRAALDAKEAELDRLEEGNGQGGKGAEIIPGLFQIPP